MFGENTAKEALKIINNDRNKAYGEPYLCFDMIAHFWSAYLGISIYPAQVAEMMCLLKIAREKCGTGKHDNFVDLVGYALIADYLRNDFGSDEPVTDFDEYGGEKI